MNRYCLKILKELSPPNPNSQLSNIKMFNCGGFKYDCISELEHQGYIVQSNEAYDPVNDKIVEVKGWALTFKGYDYISQHRSDWLKFWIPLGITNAFTLIALIISVIALLA